MVDGEVLPHPDSQCIIQLRDIKIPPAPEVSVPMPSSYARSNSDAPSPADEIAQLGLVPSQQEVFDELFGNVESKCWGNHGAPMTIIEGFPGSGKTTLLNCMTRFIDPNERTITCEDSAELQLQQPHVVRLETRPPNLEGAGEVTMRDLVKNCLRMRPERIIVGEVRGPEAFDLLQAMNTGHDGSMGTIHANNPREALSRVENMIAMGGYNLPAKAVREQIAADPRTGRLDHAEHGIHGDRGVHRVTALMHDPQCRLHGKRLTGRGHRVLRQHRRTRGEHSAVDTVVSVRGPGWIQHGSQDDNAQRSRQQSTTNFHVLTSGVVDLINPATIAEIRLR